MEAMHLPVGDAAEQTDDKEVQPRYLYLLIASSTIGGFLFGYDTVNISRSFSSFLLMVCRVSYLEF